jgi:hypothetical protein
LTNPATRYEPSPVIEFASKKERERLRPSALKAFFNIVDRWGVRDEDGTFSATSPTAPSMR